MMAAEGMARLINALCKNSTMLKCDAKEHPKRMT